MILLTGANGVVGSPLRDYLKSLGKTFLAVSRTPQERPTNALLWDLDIAPNAAQRNALSSCHTLIHCAPIWLLPPQLEALHSCGITRIVVFSSTSVTGKRTSQDVAEQELVELLAAAETAIKEFCQRHAVNFTILRPSLIYGYRRDENISRIAKTIQRCGFMPLAGAATGLRQPVHADDLVHASVAIIDNAKTFGKTYNVVGGETLSYEHMVSRIFTALDKKCRIVHIPLPVYRFMLRCLAFVGSFSYTAEMATRMNLDLVYDYRAAQDDFAYQPQAFLQHPERDLPR